MLKNVTLFFSALTILSFANVRDGYLYIFPKPGAHRVAVESHIIIRLDANALSRKNHLDDFIRVTDSENSIVNGSVHVASDKKSILFQPDEPLAYDETYAVELNVKQTLPSITPYTFQFKTIAESAVVPDFQTHKKRQKAPSTFTTQQKTAQGPRIMPNGVSVPGDFPHINVATNKPTGDGYIFINNWRNEGPYNIIFDNDGSPVWYQRQADGDRRRDFKVQKNGTISMLNRSGPGFIGYDVNFDVIGEYSAAGGYGTDEHECQVLQNGNYLLIGRRNVKFDMSSLIKGGNKNATIRETSVQEFTAEHELIFNWPALQHLSDGLPFIELQDPTDSFIDFPHMNAIDIDYDGHILVSNRHLSEVTKINRQTGEIIWRLGGAHSDFTFVNDPLNGFRNQHDSRSLGNNRYSVFDNGNLHNPPQSRAVEYELDLDKKTATLVWEFRGPENRNFYTHYMGNNQCLPNGNVFINWVTGDNPKAMEVTPAGDVVYEMNFADRYDTYRTFRFPWDGIVESPSLYVEQENNSLVLIFNKFGDANVDYYNIYADVQPGPTAVVDTSKKTLKKLAGLINEQNYFFRVTAVGKNGVESDCSNEVQVFVNFVNPGGNIVRNGDFSSGVNDWQLTVNDAAATYEVTGDGEIVITVENSGPDFRNIQLSQHGISLVRGKPYLFEFDAYSTTNRTIEALIQKSTDPWTNYGKLNPTVLRRASQHFAYKFIMEDASDFNARVVFNCGLFPGDVYIDNVSLSTIDGELPFSELAAPWQNQDIGNPGRKGSAGIWQDRCVINGSGSDIWNQQDQFHFAYQPFSGDGQISARVVSMTETNDWAKAGVMIRNTLQADSEHAFTCTTISHGVAFQRRVEQHETSESDNPGEEKTPYWVKLERTGDVFVSYASADGKTWSRVGSQEIEMNENIYAGFAVTSHDGDQLCEATFDDLKIQSLTHVHEDVAIQPQTFVLYPVYPNPFNPTTIIKYNLSALAKVKLDVYNIRGEYVRKLVHKTQEAGEYTIQFDAVDLPTGVYVVQLDALPTSGKHFRATHKMTVFK
jgi:regulation of enolase protein 1 (concanavalin A-like superfamily)